MCGITGWVDFARDLTHEHATLDAMTDTLAKRGPDERGTWLSRHAALGHRRLAVIDPAGGAQPMIADKSVITYNGEIYNFRALRTELIAHGHRFVSDCDTEVLLRAYLQWGVACVDKLHGIFAFGVWDAAREELVLVRDRLGVKPLYYYPLTHGALFGSEPKAILANPLARAEVGREQLCDALLFLRTPGRVPLRGMFEVKPGHIVRVGRDGLREHCYWRLEAREHTDDMRTTIATVRGLLEEIVAEQMVSDVPLCALLSGGLDSSAVSAFAAKHDPQLATFCVDFVGQTQSYRADPIRPSADAPFAAEVARHIGSQHREVVLDKARLLDPSVRRSVLRAWDLPYNFGDLDVSLHLLFAAIREHATVVLSGEGADELFGGYLWFYNAEAIAAQTFPWLKLGAHRGLNPSSLLACDVGLDAHQAALYADAIAGIPEEQRIAHLTLTRWLPILLEKKDRMSMAVGVEGRVPFCDHRLVEYVFNIPWAMKSAFALEKGILREAVRDVLPPSVVERKKAAYPTIQDAGYDRALTSALTDTKLPFVSKSGAQALAARAANGLSEFERILAESTVRLDAWVSAYNVRIDL